ncbi:MAG: phosphoribosylglycinamide formyltransferase [Mailhella sp.]|nr:phosphoribosylglycinamide formyltransferase [Mailhella sp.]
MTLDLAIVASGSGTNAQAMFDAIAADRLDARVRLVLSNRPGAKVLDRAAAFGAPALCLDHKLYASREDFDLAMVSALREAGVDTVALAGYMRIVTPAFLRAFPNRVLNIHPALLPSFPGAHGGRDALAYGVKFTGCSVHFVSEEMDAGPIIIQAAVPVLDNDTEDSLMERIHPLEHIIYPQALQWLAEGRLSIEGHSVRLENSKNGFACSGEGIIFPSPDM